MEVHRIIDIVTKVDHNNVDTPSGNLIDVCLPTRWTQMKFAYVYSDMDDVCT